MEFVYEALDQAGRLQRGRIEASDSRSAETALLRTSFEPVRLRARRSRRRRLGRRERAAFWRELEQLLRAGIPLADALNDLGRDGEPAALRALALPVAEAVGGGEALSAALARHGFDAVSIGLVTAGEQGGRLVEAIAELAKSAEDELGEAMRLRQALSYPLLIAVLGIAVAIFILLYLVPALAGFVDATRRPPPWSLQWLLAASGLLRTRWPWLLAALPVLLLAFGWLWRRLGAACWSWLPVVGTAWTHLLRARLARQFGLLYGAGLTVPDSLALLDALLPDRRWRRRLARCRSAVAEGRGVAEACAEGALFPGVSLRVLRVGEHSGRLDAALDYVARYHGQQGAAGFARLQRLAEPLLTVALGGLLGLLMAAVLGPVYDGIGQLR